MSDHQAGFRAQQRFSDPAGSEPAEWTAPTPPNGSPLGFTSRPLVPQHDDPAPYPDLSTVALLGQPKRAPSQGWRKWLYFASFKLINVVGFVAMVFNLFFINLVTVGLHSYAGVS